MVSFLKSPFILHVIFQTSLRGRVSGHLGFHDIKGKLTQRSLLNCGQVVGWVGGCVGG